MCVSDIRGMTREEAELEFVIITQKMDGFGDEYYPAKVSTVNVYFGSNQQLSQTFINTSSPKLD